jgi:hypothetical protein
MLDGKCKLNFSGNSCWTSRWCARIVSPRKIALRACFVFWERVQERARRERGTSTNAAESMIAIKFTVDWCIARALEKVTLICFNSQMSNRQTQLWIRSNMFENKNKPILDLHSLAEITFDSFVLIHFSARFLKKI